MEGTPHTPLLTQECPSLLASPSLPPHHFALRAPPSHKTPLDSRDTRAKVRSISVLFLLLLFLIVYRHF